MHEKRKIIRPALSVVAFIMIDLLSFSAFERLGALHGPYHSEMRLEHSTKTRRSGPEDNPRE